MTNTTLADLFISAQTAANKAAAPNADGTARDALAIETLKLEEFGGASFDRADFPTWENAFNAQLASVQSLARQASPATLAAQKAAAAAK